MKIPLCPTLLCATFLLSTAAIPQTIPPHARDGGSRETLESISIPPKPGAPFSATVVTDWTRLLADGTTTTIYNFRSVARDSAGHVFQERRFLTPTGNKQQPPLSSLQYLDPDRHEFYNCLPRTHVCTVSTYRVPATIPTPVSASADLPNGAGSVTREDLGRKNIDNLEALGSREITTIKAGVNGYTKPEPTIKEFWYSPRLEVNLISRRFEPRGGAENFVLQDINLAEPDPRLFLPPEGYRVVHTDL